MKFQLWGKTEHPSADPFLQLVSHASFSRKKSVLTTSGHHLSALGTNSKKKTRPTKKCFNNKVGMKFPSQLKKMASRGRRCAFSNWVDNWVILHYCIVYYRSLVNLECTCVVMHAIIVLSVSVLSNEDLITLCNRDRLIYNILYIAGTLKIFKTFVRPWQTLEKELCQKTINTGASDDIVILYFF